MYSPQEDSYLLSEILSDYLKTTKFLTNVRNFGSRKSKDFLGQENRKIKILDMGSGSGIQALACIKLGFKNLVCADIDKQSLEQLKKQKLKAVKSNLFEKIKSKFDLIIFNPPYLAKNKFDKQKDTSGGKHGDETILAFLQQAKKHLNNQGKIILLISSLTPKQKINKLLIKLKYKKETIATKKIFFELLEIWLIS